MMKRLLITTTLAWALCTPVMAQDNSADKGSDFGIWYSVGAEKKINKKWSVEAEGEFRTRNNSQTADRWSLGLSADYKILKSLKVSAGYIFLYSNRPEKITYHEDGSLNGWRPSFWSPRHRFNVSVQGKVGVGRFDFALRERWQYTYTPEATATRYDFDDNAWDLHRTVSGGGENVLRSRLQVNYNIPKCKFDPYASVEFYNAWKLEKTRYMVGVDWKLTKKHTVGVAYRFQTVNDKYDDEANEHSISITYNYKF